ncbi:type 1 glutamine amidotransferase domain-containing protein [Azospirillum doebereinerae]|uniref:Type 1 glutamine amidotransferase domain-containing protein n=1 Tax=Azospirillum doebereinerae TaxID=92933 RepID=A0A433J9W2_9PROT|nr:type 1 glutamine amidotransferase domain-containing protein [Azospirillum doebereinerae]MCG5238721.1 type 1 glutamine amidotransferase domain-containing protein [Azospirillum doebereinerae]RUQ72044.1 type 1 glutamine amidotransferase domain-containing protein [Azospirillum doebereinerae]
MSKILFILTSHDRMLNGEPTGLWLEEHAVPWLAFTGAGHEVVVSSMAGGRVPVDPKSAPTPAQADAWKDAIDRLADTPAFDTLDADGFDAVHLPGGHGTVFDMPYNRKLHDLLFRFDATGRVIASLCHAPAVFAGMRRPDGTPFIAGRTIAAFTDAEERAVQGVDKVPFLLESRLKELGATHHPAADWASNAIKDGRLVTGQNPQSSAAVANLVLGLL